MMVVVPLVMEVVTVMIVVPMVVEVMVVNNVDGNDSHDASSSSETIMIIYQ